MRIYRTTAGVKSNLLNNVDPLGSLSGRVLTNGRLNVDKAIRACSAPATPDFSVSATPASQTVVQAASATYTATLTPSGGFTGTVTFSATGAPAGTTGELQSGLGHRVGLVDTDGDYVGGDSHGQLSDHSHRDQRRAHALDRRHAGRHSAKPGGLHVIRVAGVAHDQTRAEHDVRRDDRENRWFRRRREPLGGRTAGWSRRNIRTKPGDRWRLDLDGDDAQVDARWHLRGDHHRYERRAHTHRFGDVGGGRALRRTVSMRRRVSEV